MVKQTATRKSFTVLACPLYNFSAQVKPVETIQEATLCHLCEFSFLLTNDTEAVLEARLLQSK